MADPNEEYGQIFEGGSKFSMRMIGLIGCSVSVDGRVAYVHHLEGTKYHHPGPAAAELLDKEVLAFELDAQTPVRCGDLLSPHFIKNGRWLVAAWLDVLHPIVQAAGPAVEYLKPSGRQGAGKILTVQPGAPMGWRDVDDDDRNRTMRGIFKWSKNKAKPHRSRVARRATVGEVLASVQLLTRGDYNTLFERVMQSPEPVLPDDGDYCSGDEAYSDIMEDSDCYSEEDKQENGKEDDDDDEGGGAAAAAAAGGEQQQEIGQEAGGGGGAAAVHGAAAVDGAADGGEQQQQQQQEIGQEVGGAAAAAAAAAAADGVADGGEQPQQGAKRQKRKKPAVEATHHQTRLYRAGIAASTRSAEKRKKNYRC